MSDEWAPPPPPKPKRRWPRRLAWTVLGLFLVLLVAYLFLTSFTFLDVFILPRVSQAVNAKITLGDASIHPFFSVTLRGLKVQTGLLGEPLLTAKELRARYSLFDIIGGHINVTEVLLDSPVINLIEDEDGGTNLDPLLKSSKDDKKPAPAAPTQKSKPLQLAFETVTLQNATVRRQKRRHDGGRDLAELSNINLKLSNLGNGHTGRLGLGADIKVDSAPAAASTNAAAGPLEAKLAGNFEFALSAELQPQSIRGKTTLDLARVPTTLRDLADLGLVLECDITPTEIKQIALTFAQKGATLGQITATGPLDLAKQEGRIKLDISSIDRRVLNLAGATLGIDFGPTTINASHEITLASGGQLITATGRFGIGQLSITQKGATTKPLDLQLDYQVALNQADKSALVSNFTLTGTQNQAPLLRGALARPMKLSFGNASNAVEESAFDLVVTNFNLADWRAFVGDYGGTAGLTLNILAQQAGKSLKVDLAARLEGLSATLGSNRLEQAGVTFALHSRLEDFNRLQLDDCSLQLTHQARPALNFGAAGNYNVKSQEADLRTTVDVFLPVVAGLLGKPDLKISTGKLGLRAQLNQKDPGTNQVSAANLAAAATGSLQLDQLAAEYGAYKLDGFETGVTFAVGLSNQLAEIRQLSGTFRQGGQNGGGFAMSGSYHLTNQIGQLVMKLTDLNQNLLRPILAPALGDKTLSSVSISLTTSASYAPKAESSVKTEVQVNDFLILDPKGQLPKTPLTVQVKLDAGLRGDQAAIRQFTTDIRQGTRQGGHFEVSGSYDLTKQTGQGAVQVADLNQDALSPLLASALGDKTLRSASINLNLAASYDSKGEASVNGSFQLANLLLSDPQNQLPKSALTADLKLNAALRNDQAQIRELTATLKMGDLPGGVIAVSGGCNLKSQSGQLALKLKDVNQNLLAPFLASALGDKRLSSISINADTEASYDPKGPAALKGRIDVANLLVSDPAGKLPKTPLALGVVLNGAFAKQLLSLEQLQLILSPTARAKNELSLTGRVDLANTKAISGELQLAAESLDLTPYYDMFAGPPPAPGPTNTTIARAPVGPAPKPAPSSPPGAVPPPQEPAPVALPLGQFAFGLNIGQLYLREVAIKNWQATAQLGAATVKLQPFKLQINDAPFSATADLNLGMPGYQYDVTLAADKIPVEPLANTFMPQARGQYKGDLICNVQVKGAGITGVNLQKNLSGQVAFIFTNANLQIAGSDLKAFFVPIGLLLGAPELVNAPLSSVGASARMGAGKINLTQFSLLSDSFSANTQGDIKIADVLMKSPLEKWPMHFYLKRELAEKTHLLSKNTPSDAAYAKLPDFIKVAGTLGEPKAELSATALGGTVLEKVTDRLVPKDKGGGLLDLLTKPK